MKRIILWFAVILIGILVGMNISYASPFLVCDPYPSEVAVTKITGTVDGQSFETAYSLHPTGAAIIYDMGALNLNNPHNFGDIRACNPIGCSDPAISFTSPVRPSAPANLRFMN